MRAMQICTAVLVVSLCSGCVVPMSISAGAKGRVVDATAHRPLEGASVRVKDVPAARMVTASDGSFSLAGRHRWVFILAPTCRNGPIRSILVVEKPGYRSVELPIIDGDEKPLQISLRVKRP